MDIFAHAAWTNIVFYKKYQQQRLNRFLSIVFGLLPDFVSFSPVFIYGFFRGEGLVGLLGSGLWVVDFASESYKYTHSIVIFCLVVFIVFLVRKYFHKSAIYWPMFGWALHILIDIPTHKSFYETPFLFPLSNYRFENGISWGHPTFMLINYGVLVAIYLSWFFLAGKKSTL